MKIESTALAGLMVELAADLYADRPFKRRQLMDAAEQEVRRRQLWTPDDDILSSSVGAKSRGLATIDYRFSDLAARGDLISDRRNVWRVNPTILADRKNTPLRKSDGKPESVVCDRPHYLARISHNSESWQRPTRDAQAHEEEGTYNQEYGFGHEDWLFRNEWLIDGWRYGFVQGVNHSHAKLVAANEPFDLTLFTIDDQKRRRYIATISAAECLDDKQADAALDEFKKRGWHEIMLREIQTVGGKASALGDAQWAKHVLNIRYRLENVRWFPAATFAAKEDPIFQLNRYTLNDLNEVRQGAVIAEQHRRGSPTPPPVRLFIRRATPAVECTPEHARMQAQLLIELKSEFPNARILCEEDYVDVSVQTTSELILFEIKSDLEPRTVIRQALGQILEYAYHPNRRHTLPLRLVIVGRMAPSNVDKAYLDRLRTEFALPVSYRVVPV